MKARTSKILPIFNQSKSYVILNMYRNWSQFYRLLAVNSYNLTTYTFYTQGVLASKFPISIQMQIQGWYRCQNVQKTLKNHLPVSNFATILLNLRKTQKSLFLWNSICYQRNTFQGTFCQSLMFVLKKMYSLPEIKIIINYKMGHGCKIWNRSTHRREFHFFNDKFMLIQFYH